MEDALAMTGLDGVIRAAGLHFVRILAAIAVLPVFSPASAKLQKLGLACVLGGAILCARGIDRLVDPGSDPVLYAVLVAKEVLVGLTLGWSAGLVFEGVRLGGTLLATEMGLNMASQVDPATRTSQPVLSHFFESITYVLFFTSGGAGSVLRAILLSFDGVPVGTFSPTPAIAETLLGFTGTVLTGALRFAGPVFVLLVIVTFVVGLLAKVAPALNVLEASYPVRIVGALVSIALFLPTMMSTFDQALATMATGISRLAAGGS